MIQLVEPHSLDLVAPGLNQGWSWKFMLVFVLLVSVLSEK